MAALFAFLHHLAAFTLVASLAVEMVVIGGELTLQAARKLRLADLAYGISAGLLLIVGLARVSLAPTVALTPPPTSVGLNV